MVQTIENSIDIDRSEIIRFTEENDVAAFERLILRHQDHIYNFCYRYLGNEADASDCTQEVFIRLFENLKTFRFESKFSTWLYRITLNTCKNMTGSRTYRVQQQAVRSSYAEEDTSYELQVTNNDPNPQEILQNSELKNLLQEAIDTLKGKQKTVLILRDLQGNSYEEIATITGLKMGTVRSTLNRARLKVAGIISNKLER